MFYWHILPSYLNESVIVPLTEGFSFAVAIACLISRSAKKFLLGRSSAKSSRQHGHC